MAEDYNLMQMSLIINLIKYQVSNLNALDLYRNAILQLTIYQGQVV